MNKFATNRKSISYKTVEEKVLNWTSKGVSKRLKGHLLQVN